MQKILPIAATFLVLVLVTSGIWSYLAKPAKVAPEVFPAKLIERVLLPGADQEEVNRKVTFKEDGFTVARISVDYPDGSSGYAIYRDDGNVDMVYMFYPQVDNAPAAKKMEAKYAIDGEHLVWEKHFYPDGSLKRTGERVVSGDYLVYDHAADQTSEPVASVFSKAGTKYNVVERHANGNFSKLALEENGVKTVTTFHETGLKATYHRAHYGKKVWETYQADGETLVIKFELKASGDHHGMSYEMHGTYFNADGSINHTREFSRYYMLARFFDADGNFTHSQRWNNHESYDKVKTVEQVAHDRWFLVAVRLRDTGVSTQFHFEKDGRVKKYLKRVVLSNGEEKLETRDYHPDGSLKVFRRPNPDDLKGDFLADEFEPGESKETFDMSLIEGLTDIAPYQLPPELPPIMEYGGYP